MSTLNSRIVTFIGLLLLFSQQAVFADDRSHSHRSAPVKRYRTVPSPHRPRSEQLHFDRRHTSSIPSYRQYYKPGHRVKPLPYGSNRIFVDRNEYYVYDGYFYRPSRSGYVIVDSPIGAIVANLPRLHHIVHWQGLPYFIVGNTFYRKHRRGYIVVPNPGFGDWR